MKYLLMSVAAFFLAVSSGAFSNANEDLKDFLKSHGTEIGIEEWAASCLVLLEENELPTIGDILLAIDEPGRSAVYEHMVYLDAAYNEGNVASALLLKFKGNFELLTMAVKSKSAAGRYVEAAAYLNAAIDLAPELRRELRFSILEQAALDGRALELTPDLLGMSQAEFDAIIRNPDISERISYRRKIAENVDYVGIEGVWDDVFNGLETGSGQRFFPKSLKELEAALDALQDTEERFTLRFRFAANQIKLNNLAVAKIEFDKLKSEAFANNALTRTKLKQVCYLAEKLNERSFIEIELLESNRDFNSTKNRRQLLPILCAACGLGMYDQVAELLAKVDRPTFSEIEVVASSNAFVDSAAYTTLTSVTKIRITTYRKWLSLISKR